MSSANYQLYYRNQMGEFISIIPFSTLQYARKENEYGTLVVTLPPKDEYTVDYFKEDGQLEVWRSVDGTTPYLELETLWFIRKIERYTASNSKEIKLTAFDLIHLINRPTIAYAAGTEQTINTGYADDEIKQLVRENLGVLATDTNRDLSAYLSVQGDASLGQSVTLGASWKSLLTGCQTWANASYTAGTPIIFDVVYLAPLAYEFRTYTDYRGVDHRQSSDDPVIISEDFGNLSEPKMVMDYTNEANYIYCGGQGQGNQRLIKEAYDATRIGMSPFNRCEKFVDARNTEDPSAVQDQANAALIDGRPRIVFTGSIAQTAGTIYGVHFGYGDYVTAKYDGYNFDCRINKISVNITPTAETISAALEGVIIL